MWIYTTNGFVSIVEPRGGEGCPHKPKGDYLLVRARLKGHLEALFPAAKVQETPGKDYRFRALVPRKHVINIMSNVILGIDYRNFKGTVSDQDYHRLLADTWSAAWSAQERAPIMASYTTIMAGTEPPPPEWEMDEDWRVNWEKRHE